MTKWSGRTTAYEHKHGDWTKYTGPFEPAIRTQTVFEVQWSECPVEVEEEVQNMWRHSDGELKNGSYADWNRDGEYWDETMEDESTLTMAEAYPLIDEFLMSKGISQCKIHWWW